MRHSSKRFSAAACLTVALMAAAPAPAKPVTGDELGRAIDRYVEPLVTAGHLSGQLLVRRGDAVLVERNYGFANIELSVPVTSETRFNIASVTKPMTTCLALRLMERKQIGYRDPVSRWIPDFPMGDSITVEHLLRHRSGIPHEIVPDSAATRPRTAAEMVEFAKKLPLDFPPGTRSSYSSGGFTVLARILEIASGRSYGTLLDEEILGPLGMTHSGHADGRILMPGRAACYVPGAAGLENASYQDLSGLVGAGSVWSTARDLDRFVQAVTSGKLGESARQSFVRSGRLAFNGRTSGFKAYADWDSTGFEVIFLGNVATGAPELLQAAIPKLAAGQEIPPPDLPETVGTRPSRAELEPYEGTFLLGSGVRLVLSIRDGFLHANDWILLPTTGGRFFSPRDYGRVEGVRDSTGAVASLNWTQGDQVYPAPRVAGK